MRLQLQNLRPVNTYLRNYTCRIVFSNEMVLLNFLEALYQYKFKSLLYHSLMLIPQGTIDNNLGPDSLAAGPKALDPDA